MPMIDTPWCEQHRCFHSGDACLLAKSELTRDTAINGIVKLTAERDALAARLERATAALKQIEAVDPISATTRLDVTEWADALDRAQRIARDALAEGEDT